MHEAWTACHCSGITFLVVVAALGTFITNYIPVMNTPQVQTIQAGLYTVALRINP